MTQTTNAHDDTNEPAAITLTLTPKEAEAISDLIEDEAFCTQGTDAQPAFWLALFTKIKEARGDTLPRDHFPTLIHTEEGDALPHRPTPDARAYSLPALRRDTTEPHRSLPIGGQPTRPRLRIDAACRLRQRAAKGTPRLPFPKPTDDHHTTEKEPAP